jgi:hypothetical protein
MDRRTLMAGSLALTAAAQPALASGPTGDAVAPALNIAGVGLPVIEGGRIRNYVFVSLRLHLGAGKTPEQMRSKEAYFRDALVKAAHRTPFLIPGDWTRLDGAALQRSLVASANQIAGRGAVVRVEIINQTPRRRTGVRAG